MALAATARFSDRADDYVRYRPGYPPELFQHLRNTLGLKPGWSVADLGAGTGIFSRYLLQEGCTVYGVEPNGPMREAAEAYLADQPKFRSVGAPAEATTLPPASVEMITAATAFHWFDPAATRAEALRILKPGGWAVLVWNVRDTANKPFLQAYDALLAAHAPEYTGGKAEHRAKPESLTAFFGRPDPQHFECPNFQWVDWDGLQGRMQSSSYCPKPGHPNHAPLMAGLRKLFDAHQTDGRVRLDYVTLALYGQMLPA